MIPTPSYLDPIMDDWVSFAMLVRQGGRTCLGDMMSPSPPNARHCLRYIEDTVDEDGGYSTLEVDLDIWWPIGLLPWPQPAAVRKDPKITEFCTVTHRGDPVAVLFRRDR